MLSTRYGSGAAARKLLLLERVATHPPTRAAEWSGLNDLVCFLRAYPPNESRRPEDPAYLRYLEQYQTRYVWR